MIGSNWHPKILLTLASIAIAYLCHDLHPTDVVRKLANLVLNVNTDYAEKGAHTSSGASSSSSSSVERDIIDSWNKLISFPKKKLKVAIG